jgi:hypothetical protein
MNWGYLGGKISFADRKRLIAEHLLHRPAILVSSADQCTCGSIRLVTWRKRYYCVLCGRWKAKLAGVYSPAWRNSLVVEIRDVADGIDPGANAVRLKAKKSMHAKPKRAKSRSKKRP